MKISASLYSSGEGSLEELINSLDEHHIDYFHIDCRDNAQVFDDIEKIRSLSKTPIDLHLISAEPDKYFKAINELNVDLVTFQFEDLNGYKYGGGLKSKMGLSIVSDTDIQVFEAFADLFDFVLMMATTPGMSGGSFDKINFRKIRKFRKQFPGKSVHVDGGVNGEVSFILRNMGVEAAVVGSYLFKNMPVGAALLNLKLNNVESHYLVRDFMRTREEIPMLGPNQRTLKDVLQSIEENKLGFTILEDQHQKLEGIISNADMRRELIRKVEHPEQISVEGMTNTQPISITEDMTVEAMLNMVKQFAFPISYLPVVDVDNKVKGVVSFLNLVKGEL